MTDSFIVPEYAWENGCGFFWLENGIVHVYNKPTTNLTIKDALENIRMSRNAARGSRSPIVVDITEVRSMERAAREVYASAGNSQFVTAIALITRNAVSRVIGNFFIGFNRPEVPIRLFHDYSTALGWVQQFHH